MPAETTEAQLIEENARLRSRVAELESHEPNVLHEQTRLALRERMKELDCLYALGQLRERHFPDVDAYLQNVADRLPESFLLSAHACARVRVGKQCYVSPGFVESRFRIASEIVVDDESVGTAEVFYRRLEELPPDGPFLPEEYRLMKGVSDAIGRAIEQMRREVDLREAHKALQCEHRALQETNIALRTVMTRLEHEKREIQSAMLENIRKIVMPIVFELELHVPGQYRAYVSLLRQNLNQITDSFLTEMCRNHLELSPMEIVVATMIRNGLSTKEIARIRSISQATVRRHRENIRRKLGLTNRKVNLVTYLQSGPESPAATGPAPQSPVPDNVLSSLVPPPAPRRFRAADDEGPDNAEQP